MSAGISKTRLYKEVVEKGLTPNNGTSSGTTVFLMKNHSEVDLDIELVLRPQNGAVPTPGSDLVIVDNNVKFANENPNKVVQAAMNKVSLKLLKDTEPEDAKQVAVNVRNHTGGETYYISSINGSPMPAPGYRGISYLLAQKGVTYNYETLSPADSSAIEVLSNPGLVNENLVLQYSVVPDNEYGTPDFSMYFSYMEGRVALSSKNVDIANKRATLEPYLGPLGGYVNTDISGYMAKSFTDPNDGLQKVNVGYAFRVPNNDTVFTAVITVPAPFLGFYDAEDNYIDATPQFSDALRASPDSLEPASSTFAPASTAAVF